MGLRPVPARWFEALAARDDLSRVAEALAQSGVVQIESREESRDVLCAPELAAALLEHDRLARRYGPHWPSERQRGGTRGAPSRVAGDALERLGAWAKQADPVIERVERVEQERADLALLAELLRAGGDELPNLGQLRDAGPLFGGAIFVLPKAARSPVEPVRGELAQEVTGATHTFVLALERAGHPLGLEKARPLSIPDWISGNAGDALRSVEARLSELGETAVGERAELAALAEAHALHAALGDLEHLRWFASAVPRLPETRHFAVITGWTSDPGGEALTRALEARGVTALVGFPPAPADREPPVVLSNPKWLRPFETFALLLGTPAAHEPDPSPWLAVIAPLLFGFMFGDVGQGLVLMALGFVLRKRVPVLRLMIPGGAVAVGFGLLFGSVFAREDVVAAVWLHPLARPLPVLLASVTGGGAILLVGLLLDGLHAHFRGGLGRWLATDGALVPIYLGIWGMFLTPRSGIVALAAVLWHAVGSASLARERRLAAAFAALAHLVERTLELAVNTVSFARVGAFALAHAGLCSAVAGLAAAMTHPAGVVVILLVGNAFCIALEGLVVSIQTTRLVLFEFFVRFLKGEGRAFRPLTPPPALGPPPASQGAHAP